MSTVNGEAILPLRRMGLVLPVIDFGIPVYRVIVERNQKAKRREQAPALRLEMNILRYLPSLVNGGQVFLLGFYDAAHE